MGLLLLNDERALLHTRSVGAVWLVHAAGRTCTRSSDDPRAARGESVRERFLFGKSYLLNLHSLGQRKVKAWTAGIVAVTAYLFIACARRHDTRYRAISIESYANIRQIT